jgi:hypothetical protein
MAKKKVPPEDNGLLVAAAKTIGKAAGKIASVVGGTLRSNPAKPSKTAKPAKKISAPAEGAPKPAKKRKRPAKKKTAPKAQ